MHSCGAFLVDWFVDLVIGWYLVYIESATASTFYPGAGEAEWKQLIITKWCRLVCRALDHSLSVNRDKDSTTCIAVRCEPILEGQVVEGCLVYF
jgi:hypothetical protein